jgi:hypothetical protein
LATFPLSVGAASRRSVKQDLQPVLTATRTINRELSHA